MPNASRSASVKAVPLLKAGSLSTATPKGRRTIISLLALDVETGETEFCVSGALSVPTAGQPAPSQPFTPI